MAIVAKSSLEDVCFEVCTALLGAGITAVLTGGSAATIYAPTVYQSRDADFIITTHATGGAEVLAKLGYVNRNGTYTHPVSRYTLEFPRGPLAVGNDLITEWQTLHRDDQALHILSRTDCVRDRLLWFYVYNDRSALSAALGVAQSGVIEYEAIQQWSAREGYKERCAQFFEKLDYGGAAERKETSRN